MAHYKIEPMKELENIANKMRKFVDEFPDSFSFEVGNNFQPRIDVVHDDATVSILAELPGVEKSSVHLMLQENSLVLKGEKKKPLQDERLNFSRMERQYGSFQRTIPLPIEVIASSIDARMETGILEVKMKKAQTKEAEKINIEIK